MGSAPQENSDNCHEVDRNAGCMRIRLKLLGSLADLE